jgi:hypothetical protein
MTEIVEGEVLPDLSSTDLVPIVPTPLNFVDDPEEFLATATAQAKVLKRFLDNSKSIVKIGQTEHVRVGGWQFLAQQAGLSVGTTAEPITLEDDSGWKAHANVYRHGQIVGEADALCLRSESNWKNRDTYALCSMAQTRAISKSIKGILGFVVVMAGYSDTPAEEMPRDEPKKRAAAQKTELPGETFEDIFKESHTSGETPSKAAATKLNLLVVELRDAGKITTEQLYHSIGLMRDVDPDDLAAALPDARDEIDVASGTSESTLPGKLHWGPLSKTLSKGEAHQLIDRLSKLQAAE